MANTLSVGYIGRHTSTVEDHTGSLADGVHASSTYNSIGQDLWVYGLRIVMNKRVGQPDLTLRMGMYDSEDNGDPSDRLGYSGAITVSSTTPALRSLSIEHIDQNPDIVHIMAYGSKRHSLSALATGGTWDISFEVDPTGATDDTTRRKNGVSQPPPDPYTYTDDTDRDQYTMYAEGWVNAEPEKVTTSFNLNPTNGSTIDDTSPTFRADFKDKNGDYGASSGLGIDSGDFLSSYQLQLRVQGTTTNIWNTTYTANGSEKTANAIGRSYGGSPLSRGTTYEWRVRVADAFGDYSQYSDWFTFTLNAQGFVTLNGNPTGAKYTDNTPDFQGRWTHQAALDMTRAQVRVYSGSPIEGVLIETGADYNIADVPSSASPGTLFTVTWANAGLSTLEWGTLYNYQIRGSDGTHWSDWSSARDFTTDYPPNVPTSLSPNTSVALSSYPLLKCKTTDADDTTGTATVKAVITRPNASTVTVTFAYNATTGFYEKQLTGTEVTLEGSYTWEPYAYDGVLYSGETQVEASASKSIAVFVYAAGPSVTITNPTDGATITTGSLGVTWTTTDQQQYKVGVISITDNQTIYQSNHGDWIVSTTSSHEIPIGYLRNLKSYTLRVTVKNSAGLSGSSVVTFDEDIIVPDPVTNFQLISYRVSTDPWDTAHKLSWDISPIDSNDFKEYTIYRRADGGPDEDEVILARVAQTQLSFVDYTPASGYTYTYGIRVVSTSNGLDYVESDVVEAMSSITLGGVVLTLVGSETVGRAILMYHLQGDPLGIQSTRRRPEAAFLPLSGGEPRTNLGENRWWETTVQAILVDDKWASAQTRVTSLRTMDELDGTICVRDDRGNKGFYVIPDSALVITPKRPLYYDVTVGLRGEYYVEGESA